MTRPASSLLRAALILVGATLAVAARASEKSRLAEWAARVAADCALDLQPGPVAVTVWQTPGANSFLYAWFHRERRLLLFDAEALRSPARQNLLLRRNWDLREDVRSDPGGSTYLLSVDELAGLLVRMAGAGETLVLPASPDSK